MPRVKIKKEVLSIKVGKKNINELTEMSINKIYDYITKLKLTKKEQMISELIIKEIEKGYSS